MEKLEKELLDAIVQICDIREDIPPGITIHSPLTGPDSLLGLDSLDAVEIVVMVQDIYKVRVQGQEQGRQILSTLKTLADFIRKEVQ